MNENWADTAIEFMFKWGASLPLSLGDKTRSKFIRSLCFLVMVAWAVPGLLIFGILALPLILFSVFTDYVTGAY